MQDKKVVVVVEKEEKVSDGFDRKWITENSIDFLSQYAGGITLRQLYYRLVSRGMINDTLHYKRVVSAMTDARWKGDVDMDAFIDRERAMFGETKCEEKDVMWCIEEDNGDIYRDRYLGKIPDIAALRQLMIWLEINTNKENK